METVRVVRGKRKWKKDFAHLSIISSPGLLPALFGPRAENILMDIYLSEKNLFFYKNTYFALVDSRPAGLALVYSTPRGPAHGSPWPGISSPPADPVWYSMQDP